MPQHDQQQLLAMELLDRFGPLFTYLRGDSAWAILYSSLRLLHMLGLGLITAAFIGEHTPVSRVRAASFGGSIPASILAQYSMTTHFVACAVLATNGQETQSLRTLVVLTLWQLLMALMVTIVKPNNPLPAC
jgi:hypothetical protein